MDVHKDSVTAAVLTDELPEVQVVQLSSDLNRVRRFFGKLATQGPVRACYEASGAGYVLQRRLEADGFHCEVIAPSLIPRKPGDRRKTDRLDAIRLVQLFRSGLLTAVEVPDQEQEQVRTLLRLRLAHKREVKRIKNRIQGMLIYRGHHFQETKSYWTKKHRAWLQKLRREADGLFGLCLSTELEHLEYEEQQLRAFDAEIERYAQRSPFQSVVEALMCLRGVKTLTAMTLVCEIGDIRRFASPRELMGWAGLVPSERSSGDIQRRGPITKAGNSHVRRLLVEAAWNNRHRVGANLILERRRQGQPAPIVAIAMKAQARLSKRLHHLKERKHINVAVTAVAREMCGFVWAIMNAAPQLKS
jgi:transposase